MEKALLYSLLLMAFILSGCVARVIPYEVDRVDQEITGNRGVIMGDPEEVPEEREKKTKKMYSLEIELPDKSKRGKRVIEGNRGYIIKRDILEKETQPIEKKRGSVNSKFSFAPFIIC